MRLPGALSDGDRLQHLRAVLPVEVRVTGVTHPLFGRLLEASSFRRRNGVLLLVVRLPDGSPGTVAAEATDVFGQVSAEPAGGTVVSAEGVRRLRLLVEASMPAGRRRPRRGSASGAQTRK